MVNEKCYYFIKRLYKLRYKDNVKTLIKIGKDSQNEMIMMHNMKKVNLFIKTCSALLEVKLQQIKI